MDFTTNKENRNILSEIILFLSYVSGVIGILYSISFSPFLNFKKTMIYILSVGICIIIYVLYNNKKMKSIWIIFSLLLLFNINFFLEQWKNIFTLVFSDIMQLKKFDITETVLIFSFLVSLIYHILFS